jgi:hypothetical protein
MAHPSLVVMNNITMPRIIRKRPKHYVSRQAHNARKGDSTMTLQALHSHRTALPGRAAARRVDPALLIAAALFVAVALAEAAFIVHAPPGLPDIGSYYAIAP